MSYKNNSKINISNGNNSTQSIKEMDKSLRRIRFTLRVKLVISLFIIIGIIVYLFLIYAAASSLSIEDENIESISPIGNLEEYNAVLVFTINNPTSTSIELDSITYKIYIEENNVGEGEKGHFEIEPGTHDQEFNIVFDIRELPPTIKTLYLEQTTNLTIEGDVTIPVKIFGLFTYTTITIPYKVTKEISNKDVEPVEEPAPVVLRKPERIPIASVRLTWTESVSRDFSRYDVHMSTIKGFAPTNDTLVHSINEIHTTTYEVSDLEPTGEYYFKIAVWTTHDKYSISNEEAYPIPE
jgi:LEA14-like dessication related protein